MLSGTVDKFLRLLSLRPLWYIDLRFEIMVERDTKGARVRIDDSLGERIGRVCDFGEMKGFLPDGLSKSTLNFLKTYFRAQQRIEEGRTKKAREILNGLDKKTGWEEFENQNKELLMTVDVAVRGDTNWDKEAVFGSSTRNLRSETFR